MSETVPRNRRIYTVVEPSSGGMMRFRFSTKPPHYTDPIGASFSIPCRIARLNT